MLSAALENPTLLDIFGSILAIVLTMVSGWLVKKMKANEATRDAVESLNVGVNDTYKSFVQDLKKAREDGKLTKEEASIARTKAILSAEGVVSKAGFKILKAWGVPKLESLVQDLVNKKKNRGR